MKMAISMGIMIITGIISDLKLNITTRNTPISDSTLTLS